MDWEALGVGFAFYLIIEGILPLFNPNGLKRTLLQILNLPDNNIRIVGGISIVLGIALLYAIK
ncbi:MAG: DUF2065 domain-containing protein [Arenicella sp.]